MREGLHPCEFPADDERLDSIGAFVGKDSLNVGMMAGDMIFQQNTIAAKHLRA